MLSSSTVFLFPLCFSLFSSSASSSTAYILLIFSARWVHTSNFDGTNSDEERGCEKKRAKEWLVSDQHSFKHMVANVVLPYKNCELVWWSYNKSFINYKTTFIIFHDFFFSKFPSIWDFSNLEFIQSIPLIFHFLSVKKIVQFIDRVKSMAGQLGEIRGLNSIMKPSFLYLFPVQFLWNHKQFGEVDIGIEVGFLFLFLFFS